MLEYNVLVKLVLFSSTFSVLLSTPLQAYYERGVSKLKMGNSKGVLDLNKALAVNPLLFQVQTVLHARL